MSLERDVENGWLRREPTSAQEIADQLGVVTRSMNDAGVQDISDDLRFYTSFNAILALANTALRASGYRTTTQPGHHIRTIVTLEYTIGPIVSSFASCSLSQRSETLPAMMRPVPSQTKSCSRFSLQSKIFATL